MVSEYSRMKPNLKIKAQLISFSQALIFFISRKARGWVHSRNGDKPFE